MMRSIDPQEITSSAFWNTATPRILDPGVPLGEVSQVAEFIKNHPLTQNHLLFSSSGTSGNRKWIALSKAALAWSARQVIETIQLTSADACGLALPTYHVGGFGLVARCHFSGASLSQFTEKWHPQSFSRWLHSQKITVTSLVPTQLVDLVASHLSPPPSLRLAIIGGGRLKAEVKTQALQLGWPVRESYGMSETCSQVATENDKGELTLLKGWEAQNRDTLQLKGMGLLTGYITRNDSNELAFHDPKIDGWFTTTDRVKLSERQLTFLGRADRRVKILGELVDLDALEEKLSKLVTQPFLLRSIAHARSEHQLQLIVEDASTQEIEAHLHTYNQSAPGLERISDYKIIPELPRSPLGKILPTLLDEQ